MYSYITHPMWTSPGIVVTRFDASTGTSIVVGGRPASSSIHRSPATEHFDFPEPYGEQEVHLVPHPEPVTLPRTIDVRDVVFKVGYPADESGGSASCSSSGSTATSRSYVDGGAVSPRRLRGGVHRPTRHRPRRSGARTSSMSGSRAARDGQPMTLTYDFAVEQTGRSASAAITGTVAAIAADLVAQGRAGRRPSARGRLRAAAVHRRARRARPRRGRTRAVGLERTNYPKIGRCGSSSIVCRPGGRSRSGRTAAIARAPVGG